jgi:predicted CxxxxCH...CXXCH cytochrome family protein
MRTMSSLLLLVIVGCVGELTPLDDADELPPNADPLLGCSLGCHGTDASNAPPRSTSGATETTAVGVGAHQAHVDVAPTWHLRIECADCHVVPTTVGAAGHLDGDGKAEVTFGARAGVSSWNGSTCTTGCHGSPAWGGTHTTPTWTQVDGTQRACGSCHGAPPPPPHPNDANCASCHPTMEEGSLAFRDPESHINGVIDLENADATGGCTTCHGSPGSSAPPKDLAGNTARTSRGVGAHQQHLGPSTWHREIACSSCHTVPTTADAPGHRDGDNVAEVTFDPLNPTGVYTPGTTTCSNQYCHGNGRASNGAISWLTVGPLACGACHSINGTGMSGDHRRHIGEENMRCSECHGDVVDANLGVVNATLHVNGAREVKMAQGTFNAATRQCTNLACHGTETW